MASALAGKSVQGTRHSDTLDEDLLYTAVPVLDKGQTVGAVRLTQSVERRQLDDPPRPPGAGRASASAR